MPHKSKYNAKNERIKYKYRIHINRVGQKSIKTVIDTLLKIRHFEEFIDFKGFETFNADIADKYVNHLVKDNKSMSFVSSAIRCLKDFLQWLERQTGYRTKINYNHIDYLNLTNNQRRQSKAQDYQKSYKYDDIVTVIRAMPEKTEKDKRDKAIVSLQALTTLRISELRTVKIKNIIEEDGQHFVYVSPKDMEVKFAKTRHAVFIPLPQDIKSNVLNWYNHLLNLGYKNNDPLFPKIDSRFNQHHLLDKKITKDGIKSNTTIRDIFRRAFEDAGYKYINPHSFRKTLARHAQSKPPIFFNAVRQNLGHSSIETTMNSYGKLSVKDQREVISKTNI